MDERQDQSPTSELNPVDKDRREFLRRSVYAAYATPLITALLVEEASAANSTNNGNCSYNWCMKKYNTYPCCP